MLGLSQHRSNKFDAVFDGSLMVGTAMLDRSRRSSRGADVSSSRRWSSESTQAKTWGVLVKQSEVLWTLSTAVALSGLVAAAVGWGTHLEVAMLFVGGMAMLCTLAWYSAWRARRTMSGFVKMLVTGVLSLGFLLVGIMEPFCGAQGHSTCYSSCAGASASQGSPGEGYVERTHDE